MYTGLHVKYPFLVDYSRTRIFYTNFRRTLIYQNSKKSAQWEASCPLRTDRQRDITKLTAAFQSFANAPKNVD
jgi:hypothetical protein